jgi:deazaflavin-dependent oxidoreductase (nitroreductase family)
LKTRSSSFTAARIGDRSVTCQGRRRGFVAVATTRQDDPVAREEITDSPTGWVRRHIDEYVQTAGRKGHRWHGVDTLLLTTRGRTTGTLRRTALIYGRDGERYLVVASNGGARTHPHWYRNLVADPDVTIQIGPEVFAARARTATARERPRLWGSMATIWPDYDRYQGKTVREIPVVILERT